MIKSTEGVSSQLNSLLWEVLTAATCLAALIYLMRDPLLIGLHSYSHDNQWSFGPFFHLARGLLHGQFPLWNPFSHAGEPFAPVAVQSRLLDPIPILTILFGSHLTSNWVLLYDWCLVLENLFCGFGVYLVLRSVARQTITRLSLIPILIFSSFMLGTFVEDGFIKLTLWAPFVVYFGLRILSGKATEWADWLCLAVCIGINWQSYYFVGVWLLLLLFGVGFLLFRRDLLRRLKTVRRVKTKCALLVAVILLMALPNAALLKGSSRLVYPLRMYSLEDFQHGKPLPAFERRSDSPTSGLAPSYRLMRLSGTASSLTNYLQLVAPNSNHWFALPESKLTWGEASEGLLYIGILPWLIALLGFFKGQHELKRVWALYTVAMALISFGYTGGIHEILYYLYPPTWFLKHPEFLILFFLFGALYFFVLGMNVLCAEKKIPTLWRTKRDVLLGLGAAAVLTACLIPMTQMQANYLVPTVKARVFPLVLAFGALAIWGITRWWGREKVLGSVALAQVTTVVILSGGSWQLATYLLVILAVGVPLISLCLKRQRPDLAALVFMVCICGDLIFSFYRSRAVFLGNPSPTIAVHAKTSLSDELTLEPRSVYPLYAPPLHRMVPSEIPLILQYPFAFSEPAIDPALGRADFFPLTLEHALEMKRRVTYLALHRYDSLIESKLPPGLLENFFALNENPIQFRRGALFYDGLASLAKADPEDSVRLAKNNIFFEAREAPSHLSWKTAFGVRRESMSFSVRRYTANDLDVLVKAESPGFLYWADGYDPAWRATVNGKTVPVYRANINFKAIELPAGISEVMFSYRPLLFIWSERIFFAIQLFTLGALLTLLFQKIHIPLPALLLPRRSTPLK